MSSPSVQNKARPRRQSEDNLTMRKNLQSQEDDGYNAENQPQPRRKTIFGQTLQPTKTMTTALAASGTPLPSSSSSANTTPAPEARLQQKQQQQNTASHHKHKAVVLANAAASHYYFSNFPKTPLEKAWSAKKKMTSAAQNVEESFDVGGGTHQHQYNGSVAAVESSFLSSSSSDGSSTSGGDILNQTTMSDTTDLTASNFVFVSNAPRFLQPREEELVADAEPERVAETKQEMEEDQEGTISQAQALLQRLRPPLGYTNQRRNSLPAKANIKSHLQQAAAPNVSVEESGVPRRRESWHPSNANNVSSSLNSSVSDSSVNGTKESPIVKYQKWLATLERDRDHKQASGHDDLMRRMSSSSSSPSSSIQKQARPSMASTTTGLTAILGESMIHEAAKKNDDSMMSMDDTLNGMTSILDDLLEPADAKPNKEVTIVDTNTDAATKAGLSSPPPTSPARPGSSGKKKRLDLTPSKLQGSARRVTHLAIKDTETEVLAASSPIQLKLMDSDDDEEVEENVSRLAKRNSRRKSIAPSPGKPSTTTDEEILTITTPPSKTKTTDSPARNTRSHSTQKSAAKNTSDSLMTSPDQEHPLKEVDSPARNTRSHSKKNADSPARNTRSQDKRDVDSPARNTRSRNKEGEESENASLQSLSSSAKELDSPARNTRSRTHSPAKANTPDDSLSNKRKLETLDSFIEVGQDITVSGSKRRKSSLPGALKSSLRKASDTKKKFQSSASKSVGFGSPEAVEYNVSSPSNSMTPMLDAKSRYTMPDDTKEIEVDMKELMQQHAAEMNQSDAGSTPRPDRHARRQQQLLVDPEDHTVELEENLQQMFDNVARDMRLQQQNLAPMQEDDNKSDMSLDSPGDKTSFTSLAMSEQKAVGMETLKWDDTKTVELEVDMKTCLANIMCEDDDNEGVGASNNRRRRSSLSSHRFSLGPNKSRLSLAPEEVKYTITHDIKTGEMEQDLTNSSNEAESFNLTVPELLMKLGLEFDSDQPDVFTQIVNEIGKYPSPHVTEVIEMFASELCNQLQAEAEESSNIDADFLVKLPLEYPGKLLPLQRLVRSGGNIEATQQLVGFSEAVQQREMDKYNAWLVDVVGQLNQHLDTKIDDVQTALESVRQSLEFADDTSRILQEAESKAFRRARRKSLQRRETQILTLEEEITLLEEEVKRNEGYVQEARASHGLAVVVEKEKSFCESLKQDLNKIEPLTEEACLDLLTLSGLTTWRVRTNEGKDITFFRVGLVPKACLSIKITPMKNALSCAALLDPSLFPKDRLRQLGQCPSVVSFVLARLNSLCQKINREQPKNLAEVPELLRRYGFLVDRLEGTALELAMLQRRYNAQLTSPIDADGTVSARLEADFFDRGATTNLLISFEVSEAYPFASVDTQVDVLKGEVDLGALQNLLVKNAKPGYGYLSRTCDIVSAYLY